MRTRGTGGRLCTQHGCKPHPPQCAAERASRREDTRRARPAWTSPACSTAAPAAPAFGRRRRTRAQCSAAPPARPQRGAAAASWLLGNPASRSLRAAPCGGPRSRTNIAAIAGLRPVRASPLPAPLCHSVLAAGHWGGGCWADRSTTSVACPELLGGCYGGAKVSITGVFCANAYILYMVVFSVSTL